MPAFGFVLILAGIFMLINVFNGNLPGLFTGKTEFNFGTSNTSETSTSKLKSK